MRNSLVWCGIAAVVALAVVNAGVLAQDKKPAETHSIVSASALKWTPIISGWEITVVSGKRRSGDFVFSRRAHN